jgi:hypothetical protein
LPEAETRAKPLAPAGGASDDCGARPEKYTTSPSPPTSLVDQLMPRHEPRMTQQSQDQFPRKHDCVQCARDTLSQRPKNRRCPGPPAAGTPTPRSKEACLSRLRRRGQRNGTFEGSSPSRLPTEADSSPWQGRPPVLLPSLRKNRRGQRPAQMRGWYVQAQHSLRALHLRGRAHAAARRHAAPDRRVCTVAHAVKTRAPEHPCCLHSKGRALGDRLRAAHA